MHPLFYKAHTSLSIGHTDDSTLFPCAPAFSCRFSFPGAERPQSRTFLLLYKYIFMTGYQYCPLLSRCTLRYQATVASQMVDGVAFHSIKKN